MGAGNDILAELRTVRAELAEIKALLLRGGPAAAPASSGGGIAPDSDLDSQWGDVEIKKDPKRWTGEPMAPCRMSACSPEYLDCLAEFMDWKAGKDDDEAARLRDEGDTTEAGKKAKYAGYGRKDAARARGWAARKRRQEAEEL